MPTVYIKYIETTFRNDQPDKISKLIYKNEIQLLEYTGANNTWIWIHWRRPLCCWI